MAPWVEMPRITLTQQPNNSILESKSGRGASLGTTERILRWLFVKKRIPFDFLEYLFDQCKGTVSIDYYHCSIACVKALSQDFLSPPDPTSQKFRDSINIGAFRHLNNVSRAGDVVKVCNIYK